MEETKSGGKWKFINNEKEFEGELIINDHKGIIGLMIYYNDRENIIDSLIPDKSQIINGTLITGDQVALVDCTVNKKHSTNSSMYTIIIAAKYAIFGKNFIDTSDIVFSKMDFKVSNIIGWSGLSGFNFPIEQDYAYTVRCELKESIDYEVDNTIIISFTPRLGNCSYDQDVETVTINQFVIISISHSTPNTLEANLEVLNKVLGLISLGIGKKSEILRIDGFIGRENGTTRIFYSNKYKKESKEPVWFNRLFSLSDLTGGSDNLLSNWFSKYELLEPIIELYLSIFKYQDMSLERQFLNLVQALEAYHMRFVCKKVSMYVKRIKRMTLEWPDKEYYIEKLCDSAQESKGFIYLNNRLNDLVLAERKISLYFDNDDEKFTFTHKVKDTRHYHTHYELNKKDSVLSGLELYEACSVLKLILEYYLLMEIGLPFEHIKNKIKYRAKNIKSEIERRRG